MDIWQQMRQFLEDRQAQGLLRAPAVVDSPCGPKIVVDGREVVCLGSNDYLSLSSDPAVRAAAIEAVQQWGVGAGASRLVSGTTRLHVELEDRLAEFKRTEAAIVTSTGWMANQVAVAALAGKGDLILCDKLSHASILDGARGVSADVRTFAHCRTRRLKTLLDRLRGRYRRCLIVTDSLFSMDGDLAPLAEWVELKKAYDAQLLIDEAHATGVLGRGGRGAAELLGVENDVDAVVGTLSKAVGVLGGFVAAPRVLIETIRNAGRAFIYTTAPPPALCAAAVAALDIIRREPQRRERLLDLAECLRADLHAAGFDTGDSVSQIIPIVLGEADRALRVSGELLDAGFFLPAIRPPTVPRGSSRLRISLCCRHERSDLARLVSVLRRIAPPKHA